METDFSRLVSSSGCLSPEEHRLAIIAYLFPVAWQLPHPCDLGHETPHQEYGKPPLQNDCKIRAGEVEPELYDP